MLQLWLGLCRLELVQWRLLEEFRRIFHGVDVGIRSNVPMESTSLEGPLLCLILTA